MDFFPAQISASEKSTFPDQLTKEYLRIFRREVMMHLLRGKETDFVDLDRFNRTYSNHMATTRQIVETVRAELSEIGWNTYLGFGDTGLYIYSTPEKPAGIY